ncbi:proline-rich proteoglycan 2-like isoform X3 [Rhipicephalus sanguineus]|uniref:proline-rich proteoglycan 2-like isoform X3 n=1 Tax=Rhipicephalus sanguineus TaxID=34632 RepID=UPI0020C2F54D|nr:proline-rich proteoglycan 2-like isoform X3 [Rhipicephalus sanguineus]
MCVLFLLALCLLDLGSNPGCEAHFLGTVERGPCQAKNPLGRGFLDGTCMPMIKCKQILRGIVRLNFPVICGFELLRPIVCCPHMGHSAPGSGGKGPGDVRNPLDPFNVLDDIFKNIPGLGPAVGGPHAGTIGPFGPYGVNIPGVHSFEDYMRFLGLPHQGHNFGALPGPYVPTIPHLPHGGSFGFPINPQGNLPGPEPHVPHQPLPPHGGGGSGFPIRPDNYPPDVGPQQPHGNSPGTGSVPPQPGSGGGVVPEGPLNPSRPTNPSGPVVPPKPVVPSGPVVPPTPANKPGKRPAPGGGSNPPGEGSDDGAPCDDECEPGENDSYIHLIDPRRGKN